MPRREEAVTKCDVIERDMIVFGMRIAWGTDDTGVQLRQFDGLSAAKCRALLAKGLATPGDNTNGSPTFLNITKWIEKHPKFSAHGYVVAPWRHDSRVTLEGVEGTGITDIRDVEDFLLFFRTADELECADGCAHAWYD